MAIDVKTVVIVYIIAVVVGLGAMYIYMEMSGSFIKAQKYDYYYDYLVQIEECKTTPYVSCGFAIDTFK